MKKLLLFALLMPLLSSAQQFELSEMAGYSRPTITGTSILNFSGGFSNQLTCSYYLTRHISMGAFYELNEWKPANNSLGITADAHAKSLYFGLNVSDFNINYRAKTVKETYWGVTDSSTYKYAPALAYGLHAGINERVTKHIAIKVQLGCNVSSLRVHITSPEFNNIGPVTFPNGTFSEQLSYYYALVGISYSI